jgi:uncharacterized membrane protein
MPTYVLAFLIGVISGLRAMTAPAAVSWGARLGWLPLEGSPLAFLGYRAAPYIFTLLAIGELVNDKLPKTPSRTAPPSFAARLVSGALSGGAIGAANQSLWGGVIAGVLGAVAGTLGGHSARASLAKAIGRDLPAALVEDMVAVAGAAAVVWLAR